jgi:predicted RNase H-like nuclease
VSAPGAAGEAAASDRGQLLAVGVDGAPGGWLAATCWGTAPNAGPASLSTELHFFGDIRALAQWRAGQPAGETVPVAVDMPIGLPEVVGYRDCDNEARARLPWQQKPSVFQAPSRQLLICATEPDNGKPPKAKVIFTRAQALITSQQSGLDAAATAAGVQAEALLRLTQQAAGILAKVAEVDTFMREAPASAERDRESWLIEVHPEMCFQAMAGGGILPRKTSAHGQLQRLDVVQRAFPDADERIGTWELGRKFSLLDICDAYAACWSALRWALTDGGKPDRRHELAPPLEVLGETAPGEPVREPASGLATRMVV